jgi:hypothetical protein
LPDGSYNFRVRAKDRAGNVDGTPASRTFSVETPLRNDLQTAEAAAEFYFPDAASFDVPSSCGGSPAIDCPGGTPLPPADQLAVTSSRNVVGPIGGNRYDVTATLDVQTLQPVTLSGFGADCDATATSANGASPTWTVNVSLNFVADPDSGVLRIDPGTATPSGVETTDVSISGASLLCSATDTFKSFFISTLEDQLAGMFVGASLCAAPGPEYLGLCPPS